MSQSEKETPICFVHTEGRKIPVYKDDTILDAFKRAGVEHPSCCKSGICHTCRARAVNPEAVPNNARKTLRPADREQGWFLPCIAKPTQDITLAPQNAEQRSISAIVQGVNKLSEEISQLSVLVNSEYLYQPGQFTQIIRPADGLSRCYSLASLPDEDESLLFHVRHLPDGKMSSWIGQDIKPGQSISIGEPQGECCYVKQNRERPMLLVGTGSGLAPLYGILREALRLGHTGDLYLYHGSSTTAGIYLISELLELARKYPNFKYTRCISANTTPVGCQSGRADDLALTSHPNLTGWSVYLCGNPDMVNRMKREVYMAGVSLSDIYADPFVASEL